MGATGGNVRVIMMMEKKMVAFLQPANCGFVRGERDKALEGTTASQMDARTRMNLILK